MDKVSERSRRYWSDRAPEFSALRMREYHSPLKEIYEKFLLTFLPENKNNLRILDVGTGAGFFSLLLGQWGGVVTAVDFSAEMLEQARQNAAALQMKNIEFLQMDAQNLTFDDESFDFVFSRNVTWIVEDAAKVYSHFCRVLKPGGTLLNLDANYGKTFQEADARGETPSHPTQTLQQLRERNAIAKACRISREKRPSWDVELLIDLGISDVRAYLDLGGRLGLPEGSGAGLFAVAAKKEGGISG